MPKIMDTIGHSAIAVGVLDVAVNSGVTLRNYGLSKHAATVALHEHYQHTVAMALEIGAAGLGLGATGVLISGVSGVINKHRDRETLK